MYYICPVCREALVKDGNRCVCANGHSFDLAKSGYVNLLTASKKHSKNPGDGKEMVVARREFLDKGYYAPLCEAVALKARELGGEVYFDAGCGTGYYTSAVTSALLPSVCMGVDLSKFAVETTAKREKRGFFAVASVYDLPIASESVDIITNIFSPMADSEYRRILKKGGHMIYVVPGPRHLFSLKELLYEHPYENEVSHPDYDGLVEVERTECSFTMTPDSNEDVESLFAMTPYFWRSPADALEKIRTMRLRSIDTEFYITVLKKI